MEASRRLAVEQTDGSDKLPASARLLSVTKTFEIGNDLDDVPQFVTAVLAAIAAGLDPRKRDGLQLALREIVINAVEHGNLGVTFEEKSEANESGSLPELLAERAKDPSRAERCVRVEAKRSDESISVFVEDEGDGFEWRDLPDPTDAANLLRTHGRGVLLAALSVDELTFNDAGNRVGLVAHLGGVSRQRDE
jgi:anti-sigma regulatory factor (Ser/Thr protein kinase)